MSLPDVPGVLRARLVFDVGGTNNAHCHLFMHTTGTAVDSAALTDLANVIHGSYVDHLKSNAPNTTHLRSIETIDLGHPGTVAGLWSGDEPGSYPQAGQSAAVCTLVSLKIARRYRGGKPRIYLPFGVQAQMDSPRQWSSTYLSAMDSGWGFFTSQIKTQTPNAGVDQIVSVSYYNDNAPRATPVVDNVLTHSISHVPANQRRRLD